MFLISGKCRLFKHPPRLCGSKLFFSHPVRRKAQFYQNNVTHGWWQWKTHGWSFICFCSTLFNRMNELAPQNGIARFFRITIIMNETIMIHSPKVCIQNLQRYAFGSCPVCLKPSPKITGTSIFGTFTGRAGTGHKPKLTNFQWERVLSIMIICVFFKNYYIVCVLTFMHTYGLFFCPQSWGWQTFFHPVEFHPSHPPPNKTFVLYMG